MSSLRLAKAKSLWTQAEYCAQQAEAYKAASAAAEVIEEMEIAQRWATLGHDCENQAVQLQREARSLGYYGPTSD